MSAEDVDPGTSSISSTSSASIESDPERLPLLAPDINLPASNHKSIEPQNGGESLPQETRQSEEQPSSKSVLAIISLLLIGNLSSHTPKVSKLNNF